MYRKLVTSTAVLALTINLVAPAMADGFSSRVSRAVSQKAFAQSVVVKKHLRHSTSRKAKYRTTARSLARVNAPKRTVSRPAHLQEEEEMEAAVPSRIVAAAPRARKATVKNRRARITGGKGRDAIVVGFAPLKPAEFVIISTKKVGKAVAKSGVKVGKAVGHTSVRVGKTAGRAAIWGAKTTAKGAKVVGKTLVRGGKAVGRGVGRTGKLVVNTAVNQVKHTVGCALHPLGNCIVRAKNDTVRIGKAIGRGGKTIGRGVFRGGKAVTKGTRKVAKGVKRGAKKAGRSVKKGAKKVGRGAKKVAKKLKLW